MSKRDPFGRTPDQVHEDRDILKRMQPRLSFIAAVARQVGIDAQPRIGQPSTGLQRDLLAMTAQRLGVRDGD